MRLEYVQGKKKNTPGKKIHPPAKEDTKKKLCMQIGSHGRDE